MLTLSMIQIIGQKVHSGNFSLKTCLFGATNKVKHSGKERYVYSGYEIGFDGKGEWDFGNDFAQNVVTFGVGNSSSSHINNYKNDFQC